MRRAVAGLLTAAVLAHSAVAAAGQSPPAGARTYVDPAKKFSLLVPPGAQVIKRRGKPGIIIRSRRGFIVNVQNGAVRPDVSLGKMTAKLEARYLGPGKRWSRKLGEGAIRVGGLPAHETLYDGSGIRVRVVIARGRKTDFVFMFMAPPKAFDGLAGTFDAVLRSFRPTADEVVRRPALPQRRATAGRPRPSEPARPARPPAVRRFADPQFGFSIDYPDGWVVSTPSPLTVVFSGRKGTDAFYAVVSIQNVKPSAAGDPREAMRAVVADLKSQWAAGATDVGYFGEGPITYENKGLRLEGHQFLVTYTQGGQRFKQWTVVVPRPAGTVVHVWSYTAPDALFPVFRPIAEAMRKTWAIHVR